MWGATDSSCQLSVELHLAWALATLHYEALFILTAIPWGNDSGFTSQLGKPGLRANAITGWDHTDLNGAELQVSTAWLQVWEFLLCLVWLAPSFWEWEAKIQNSVPSICWESLRCIQREAVSFVFLKCPPLNVFVCVCMCVFSFPPAWLGIMFSLGQWWSQIPDGGHRRGSPHLSPCLWDGEFICDVRPEQDLE